MTLQGRIIKLLGGFYYVEAAETIYECRAKGVFRSQNQSPLVGDVVRISTYDNGLCSVDEILPRKNELVRPPLANLDQLVLVTATSDPKPNLLVLDTMIAIAEYKGIEPVVVVTKSDLEDGDPLRHIYQTAGIPCFVVCNTNGQCPSGLAALLAGKITAFTGNTGVGKSSLLNVLNADLKLPVGDVSKKLGRGRHTTRHTELYHLLGGLIADTPGFSMIELTQYEKIPKEQMASCFREFEPYLGGCRFSDCSHVSETSCAVRQAVESGKIARSRYDSYCAMYREVKDVKEWQKK